MARDPRNSRSRAPGGVSGLSDTAPASLGSLLSRTQSTLLEKSGRLVDRATWRRLLGDRIARHSMPDRLNSGELTVIVSSPSWGQELSLLSSEIIDRLRQSGLEVTSLRYRVGSIDVQEVRHLPPRTPVPDGVLPGELEATLRGISDAELRQAITSAAKGIFGRAQSRSSPLSEGQPDARGRQCAAPGTGRRDQSEPAPRARPPGTREGRRD